jgi:hypothetical protein
MEFVNPSENQEFHESPRHHPTPAERPEGSTILPVFITRLGNVLFGSNEQPAAPPSDDDKWVYLKCPRPDSYGKQ